MKRERRSGKRLSTIRPTYKNTAQFDGAASIPFPEIAVELGILEREVQRWARARARGKTFRASAAYRAYAIEVERRHRLIDYTLFFSDARYVDGIFENARRAVA